MTLGEALAHFRIERPCQLDDALLVRLVSDLERTVCSEIFQTHEGCPESAEGFSGYSSGDSLETELMLPPPFDRLYFEYLVMKADLLFCDTARYNNSAAVFYNDYMDFAYFYNRRNKPRAAVQSFISDY